MKDNTYQDLDQMLRKVQQSSIDEELKVEVLDDSLNEGKRASLRKGDVLNIIKVNQLNWIDFLNSKLDTICVIFHQNIGIIIRKIKDVNPNTGEVILYKNKSELINIKLQECIGIGNIKKVEYYV